MEQLRKLTELISGLMNGKFFGQIVIKFEAGKIVNLKKEESLKL